MRIITGKFRGRRLKTPRGLDVRPTSDRLRETLFDIIAGRTDGSVMVDVFAGTGAVGLEALSRGAREVVFIESAKEGCRLIQENLATLGIGSGYRLIQQDVYAALRHLARQGFKADLVFMDPPYQWGTYRDLLSTVFGKGIAAEPSIVILEHHCKADLPESGEGFRRFRVVSQSDKCLSFYGHDAAN
jgi:16S rRNA (guanine(966)-N(2))-methyltransferase RsmD